MNNEERMDEAREFLGQQFPNAFPQADKDKVESLVTAMASFATVQVVDATAELKTENERLAAENKQMRQGQIVFVKEIVEGLETFVVDMEKLGVPMPEESHGLIADMKETVTKAAMDADEKLPTVTLYFNGRPFETSLKSMTGEEILEQAKSKGLLQQWQTQRESIGRLTLVEELPNGTNRIIGRGDEIGLGFTRKFSAIDSWEGGK